MRFVLVSIWLLAALMEASLAFGAGNTPSHIVYQSGGKNVQSTLGAFTPPKSGGTQPPAGGTKAAATTNQPTTTTLPFTGLDLTLIVVAGLGLVVTGFALRRVTRKPSS
jgi:hypothetical protein